MFFPANTDIYIVKTLPSEEVPQILHLALTLPLPLLPALSPSIAIIIQGHYTARINSNGKWMDYNDAIVSAADAATGPNPNPDPTYKRNRNSNYNWDRDCNCDSARTINGPVS